MVSESLASPSCSIYIVTKPGTRWSPLNPHKEEKKENCPPGPAHHLCAHQKLTDVAFELYLLAESGGNHLLLVKTLGLPGNTRQA